MPPKEEIEKLKEGIDDRLSDLEVDMSVRVRVHDAIDRAFSLGGKSVVAQLLEALPRKDLYEVKPKLGQDLILREYGEADGWNSCRQALIAKAIQLGVVEKGEV